MSKNMDGLNCSKTIRINRRTGKEVSYAIPKPTLTAPSRKERTVQSQIKISSINTDFLGDVGSKIPSKSEYSEKELYKYLYELFSKFLEKEKIATILNKGSMKVWKNCFTHITYDPDYNYETLESVGDKIMSYTFKTLLFQKFPDISASELNNLDQYYMSTHLQSIIAAKMGLTNWLRVKGQVPRSSEKIREDVLESFFGAIDTIMIQKYGLGYGARVCMKFLEKMFDIEMNRDIEPAKTFVLQLFERLGDRDGITSSITETEIEGGFAWKSSVMLNETGLDLLKSYGKNLGSTRKFWSVIKLTKKPAEQAVFSEVMHYFLSKGITTEWAQSVKRETVIETQIGNDNYQSVLRKARRSNKDIKDIEVIEAYKSKPAKTVFQIIGKTKDRKIVLESHSSHEEKMEGYSTIIKNYLRK